MESTLKRTWAEISLDNIEHNYRSTNNILNAANDVIKNKRVIDDFFEKQRIY